MYNFITRHKLTQSQANFYTNFIQLFRKARRHNREATHFGVALAGIYKELPVFDVSMQPQCGRVEGHFDACARADLGGTRVRALPRGSRRR